MSFKHKFHVLLKVYKALLPEGEFHQNVISDKYGDTLMYMYM